MKKIVTICICFLLVISLTSCNLNNQPGSSEQSKDTVEYFVTKRYTEHDTGDINLITYEYDDKWNLEFVTTYLNDLVSSTVEYIYNEDSTVVIVKTTSSTYEATETEHHQEFDESGNLLKASSYTDGVLDTATEYSYDDQGRQIKVVTSDSDGKVYTTLSYGYDEKGNLISYIIETPAYTTKQEHCYNDKNKRIETKMYHNEELSGYIEYTWEENTCYINQYDPNNELLSKNITTYDEAGNIISEESYDARDVFKQRTCYEYEGMDGSKSSGIPGTRGGNS